MIKPDDPVWTVSALNFEIKTLLEQGVGTIWLQGEISNFSSPASGHWYFSLKDDQSQLRAAMFRNRNSRIGFQPHDGQQVLVRAQVTLYQARGEFQVIVEHLEEAGSGLLMRQFEALKNALNKEGLFDSRHKKTIPGHPSHIGIITSASGAAIHDALSVIKRRSPLTRVTLYPTPVQGEQATASIVDAIRVANQRDECEVLLLVRGGGSIEDLWCFNEEAVARAIHASNLPIISGIGHEVDVTIADFVADLRAPTPSVAAEKVTRDQYEWMSLVDQLNQRLNRARHQQFRQKHEALKRFQDRLLARHPKQQMKHLRQALQQHQQRLYLAVRTRIRMARQQYQLQRNSLRLHSPNQSIKGALTRINYLNSRISDQMQHRLLLWQQQLHSLSRSMDNLSPLKTLGRGYAVISQQGRALQTIRQLKMDEPVTIRMRDGQAEAQLKSIQVDNED